MMKVGIQAMNVTLSYECHSGGCNMLVQRCTQHATEHV